VLVPPGKPDVLARSSCCAVAGRLVVVEIRRPPREYVVAADRCTAFIEDRAVPGDVRL